MYVLQLVTPRKPATDPRSLVFIKVVDLMMFAVKFGGLKYALLENVVGNARDVASLTYEVPFDRWTSARIRKIRILVVPSGVEPRPVASIMTRKLATRRRKVLIKYSGPPGPTSPSWIMFLRSCCANVLSSIGDGTS